jgi:hypothetical protein
MRLNLRERISMPSHTPQNDEESAYISFALLEALIGLLIKKNVISSHEDVGVLILNTIKIIEATPKNANRRMTDFVRSMSFD